MGKDKYLIVGPAASGKDWLQKRFVEKGYTPLVQYTTRPKRPNEDGTEYHFISQRLMGRMIREMVFLSVKNFKTWWYGFTRQDFEKCNVGIVSIGNITDLKSAYPDLMDRCEIVYLDIPVDVRVGRLAGRYAGGTVDDTIQRRVEADEADFEYFENYTVRLSSENEVLEFINSVSEI